jgi:hypothetical protein
LQFFLAPIEVVVFTIFPLQAVANILLGLKSCTSNSEEARLVLRTLTRQLSHDQLWTKTLPKIKSKEISMCMWGLQGMSIDLPEVQHLPSFVFFSPVDLKSVTRQLGTRVSGDIERCSRHESRARG